MRNWFNDPATKVKCSICLLGLVFLVLPLVGRAISVEELEKQVQDKQNQITELQKQVDAYKTTVRTKQGEQLSLKNQIGVLESQISKLETEVKLIEAQISQTASKINDSQDKIKSEEDDLARQRENLKEIIRQINEYDGESVVALLLKNKDFSEFFNQVQYTENFQSAIQDKVEKIKLIKIQLEKERDNFKVQKEKLEEFQKNLEQKQGSLDKQKYQKEDLLGKTKGEEKRYQKLLNELIVKKAAFAKDLQELEKQILAARGFAIRVQATQIPPAGTKIFDRPDGTLTQGYGMTEFARRGAYNGAPHNGVDLSSGAGSPIMAAANGKVLAKGYNRGWGNWIAVVHSDSYNLVTLYAHFQSPAIVTVGSQITEGATIGYEGSTGFSTGSHLHFSVYDDFFTFLKSGELYFNYFEGTLNPLSYFK